MIVLFAWMSTLLGVHSPGTAFVPPPPISSQPPGGPPPLSVTPFQALWLTLSSPVLESLCSLLFNRRVLSGQDAPGTVLGARDTDMSHMDTISASHSPRASSRRECLCQQQSPSHGQVQLDAWHKPGWAYTPTSPPADSRLQLTLFPPLPSGRLDCPGVTRPSLVPFIYVVSHTDQMPRGPTPHRASSVAPRDPTREQELQSRPPASSSGSHEGARQAKALLGRGAAAAGVWWPAPGRSRRRETG